MSTIYHGFMLAGKNFKFPRPRAVPFFERVTIKSHIISIIDLSDLDLRSRPAIASPGSSDFYTPSIPDINFTPCMTLDRRNLPIKCFYQVFITCSASLMPGFIRILISVTVRPLGISISSVHPSAAAASATSIAALPAAILTFPCLPGRP